jgi:hypothetical protein
MLTSSLHTKWIMRFFVMIYLLLSFSTANASFWCLDEESSSHLESNPIGRCWTDCLPNTDTTQQTTLTTQTAVFSSGQEDECLDSPVYTSALTSSQRTSTPNKVFATDFDTDDLHHIPNLSVEVTRFANLSLPTHLPAPQTIKALRTVVLLH